jgi:hypothetical protein
MAKIQRALLLKSLPLRLSISAIKYGHFYFKATPIKAKRWGKIGGGDGRAEFIDDEGAKRGGTRLRLTTITIFCSPCVTAARTW